MKTINYELVKKLYEAGVVIESENSWYKMSFLDEPFVAQNNLYTENFEYKFPAPNVEEVIECVNPKLKDDFLIISYKDKKWCIETRKNIFIGNTLIEALEATLEYLLDNGYIGNQN